MTHLSDAIRRLDGLYHESRNPSVSVRSMRDRINCVLAGLTASEKIHACREFGVVQRPKSGSDATLLISGRIIDRIESAQRCQF